MCSSDLVAGGPIRDAAYDAQELIAEVRTLVAKINQVVDMFEEKGLNLRPVKDKEGSLIDFATGKVEECPVSIKVTVGE